MAISAALVKELRERTSAGMMECKKALVETNGDIEAAVEYLRKAGMAKADKKADRTAAEGLIVIETSGDGKKAAMVEVNCETDFVAKDDNFQSFAKEAASIVLNASPADLESLMATKMQNGDSVQDTIKGLIAKIGENMSVRRFVIMESSEGSIGSYSHGSRIGVLVDMTGGDTELAKDIAMHVAASKPVCVSAEQVSPDLIEKEKEIFSAQAAESGKPPEIVEKMVSGRINKFLKEITLLGQPFVKDPDSTVEKLLKGKNAAVVAFSRFEVGEGIEKKQDNFADEVMAQVKGS
ncbi:MAG: translation elongation factor Ts [Gammaproteobacteria bacterium]|jgi:elongation factor Ts|nr:translation elongation factor Ts [Gammaproteobacteria bacterium]